MASVTNVSLDSQDVLTGRICARPESSPGDDLAPPLRGAASIGWPFDLDLAESLARVR